MKYRGSATRGFGLRCVSLEHSGGIPRGSGAERGGGGGGGGVRRGGGFGAVVVYGRVQLGVGISGTGMMLVALVVSGAV